MVTPVSKSPSAHPDARGPGRAYLVGHQEAEELCESLAQPDVAPPARRHQVAEPLVGQLVRNGGGDAQRGGGPRPAVGQQQHLPARGEEAEPGA